MSADAPTALVVQAAAGEAGKSAWSGLITLARWAFGRSHSAHGALERAEKGDGGAPSRALADLAVAEALQAWVREARANMGRWHSFTGSTPVLLADGAAKPIDQVKISAPVTNAVPGDTTNEDRTATNVIVTKTDL